MKTEIVSAHWAKEIEQQRNDLLVMLADVTDSLAKEINPEHKLIKKARKLIETIAEAL